MVIRKHDNNEGFVMRPTWWFRTNLKPTAREALTVLVSYLPYGAQSGTVFPAVKTIARDANVSERATYDALHELEDAGLITWGKRNGDKNHNEYVIHALSRQQIEALCRRKEPDQKVAEPAKSADATSAEVAKSAGARLQNLQTEVAKSAYEVEPMKENQGTRAIGLDWTGLDASGVGGQGGSQGVSQGEREDPRTTAGFPGDTAGSPLDLAGPPTWIWDHRWIWAPWTRQGSRLQPPASRCCHGSPGRRPDGPHRHRVGSAPAGQADRR